MKIKHLPESLPDIDAFVADSDTIVEQIKPLLAGKGNVKQGSVLADLVAIWIGGHIVEGDPAATIDVQADLLEVHLKTVAKLIKHYKKV